MIQSRYMNYAHPLAVGVSLTPSGGTPRDVVARARRAESLGFDLVTLGANPAPAADLYLFIGRYSNPCQELLVYHFQILIF